MLHNLPEAVEDRALEPSQRRQPAFGQFKLEVLKVMLAKRQVSQEIVTAALRLRIRQPELCPSLHGLLLDVLKQAL
jgi:hypothetical protein